MTLTPHPPLCGPPCLTAVRSRSGAESPPPGGGWRRRRREESACTGMRLGEILRHACSFRHTRRRSRSYATFLPEKGSPLRCLPSRIQNLAIGKISRSQSEHIEKAAGFHIESATPTYRACLCKHITAAKPPISSVPDGFHPPKADFVAKR